MNSAHTMNRRRTDISLAVPPARTRPGMSSRPAGRLGRDLGNGYLDAMAASHGLSASVSQRGDPQERQAEQIAAILMARLGGTVVGSGPAVRPGAVDEADREEEQGLADKTLCCAGGGCDGCGSSYLLDEEAQLADEDCGTASPGVNRMVRRGSPPPVTGPVATELAHRYGPGQPLDDRVRRAAEPLLDEDLSTVRMHPEGAQDLAADLGARAFTVGQHIYFGRDEYNPGTREGLHVLLHELVHTTQPGDETIQRLPSVSDWRFRNSGPVDTDNCAPLATGKTLGVNNHSYGAASFTNMMELRAEIVDQEHGASYDIKRIKERSTWQRVGGAWANLTHVGPGADDDSTNNDECLVPNTSPGYIFSVDYPGFRSASALDPAATEAVYKATFTESVEVSVGSAGASDGRTFDWHSVTWLTKSGGTWSVDTARSEIASGAVTVGTTAP